MANMAGRKDLGIYKVVAAAIPKQAHTSTPTRTGDAGSNDKTLKRKMEKVMVNVVTNGSSDTKNIKPHVKVKGMPNPNINHNTSTGKGC